MRQFIHIHTTLIILLLWCCVSGQVQGQYWRRTIDGPSKEWARGILALPDGGCIITGSARSNGNGWDIFITRLDAAGNSIWSQQIGTPSHDFCEDIAATSDGQCVIAGQYYDPVNNQGQVWLLKINIADGNTLWSKNFGGVDNDSANEIIELSNGDLAVAGTTQTGPSTNRSFMLRTDAQGQLQWLNYFSPTNVNEILLSMRELPDGSIVAVGGTHIFQDIADGLLIKASATGDLIFSKITDYGKGEWFTDVISLPSGRLLCMGLQQQTGVFSGLYSKFSSDGLLLESHFAPNNPVSAVVQFAPDSIVAIGGHYAFNGLFMQVADTAGVPGRSTIFHGLGSMIGRAIALGPGSVFFIAADESPAPFQLSDRVMVYKTSLSGATDENFIRGRLVHDENGDCEWTEGEVPLTNWVVEATGGDGKRYVANTDSTGQYTLAVPVGTFELSVVPQSEAWQPCGPFLVEIPTNGLNMAQDIAVLSLGEYAALSIDIGGAGLRTDQHNPLTISVHNYGAVTADSVAVKFSYDNTQVRLRSVSLMDTVRLAPDTLKFWLPTGVLKPDSAFSFVVVTEFLTVAAAGQTYQFRVDAAAKNGLPNTWKGPVIQVKGSCEGDSVVFHIRNKGINMNDAQEYIVIEDNVMGRSGTFQLPAGGSKSIKFPANGHTWRLIARQSEGFPEGKYSTKAVEGCVATGGGGFSKGFVNQFPESDEAPQTAIFSAQTQEHWDSVSVKTALPTGICGEEHRIFSEIEIEYQITFPVAGQVNNLYILDTLPSALNPASFQAGASNLPYQYYLGTTPNGTTVIRFEWDNLLNTAIKEGFVRYRLQPDSGTKPGTKISNRAMTYTNTELPMQTNTVWHHVEDAVYCFPVVAVEIMEDAEPSWSVFPNPATSSVRIQWRGGIPDPEKVTVILTDIAGKTLLQKDQQSNYEELDIHHLAPGVYFIRLIVWDHGGKKSNTPVKLIIQR